MVNLVGIFWCTDDKKCLLRVLLGSVVWGIRKVIFRSFDKKFFWDIFLNLSISIRFIEKKQKKIIFCISVKDRVNTTILTQIVQYPNISQITLYKILNV